MIREALSGRTAIVTGAGHGIGAAAARALSQAGAGVVLAAGDDQALEALAADLRAAGGHAVAVPTDITNPASARRLVEQTLGAFGRLDAAFNGVPVGGVALAMKHEIAGMRRAGRGRIVNLAAGGMRAAVIALTRAAALDAGRSGVLINAVDAGPHDDAEEVAAAVVWLCSDDARLATGATLRIPPQRHGRSLTLDLESTPAGTVVLGPFPRCQGEGAG